MGAEFSKTEEEMSSMCLQGNILFLNYISDPRKCSNEIELVLKEILYKTMVHSKWIKSGYF